MPDKETHGIVKLRRRVEDAQRKSKSVEKLMKTAILYEVKIDDIEIENTPKQGTE